MAVGVSVKLPLQFDANDGPFLLNKTAADAVKQNFKMLILTEEGEKVMDPKFGVGIKAYLFENFSYETSETIRRKIIDKTALYLPFIKILNINIDSSVANNADAIDANELSISIDYQIEPLNLLDKLQLKIV
jgi:phage baseplate assembly protein W